MSSSPRRVDPSDPRPIWRQIEDGLRREIAMGWLAPGDPVPSVRDLARELRVNPNTVARAIQSLADAGMVETRRGDGTYVAAEPAALSKTEILAGLREEASRFASRAMAFGATPEQAIETFTAAVRRLEKESKGR